jgi:hypothetical protein
MKTEGLEGYLCVKEELEINVNRALFEEFGQGVCSMGLVGRETYSPQNLEYWKGVGVKHIYYYGPDIEYHNNIDNIEKYPQNMARNISCVSHYSKYQLLTSLCSIQNYFDTEARAKIFLKNVYQLLTPGGKFICTYYSGNDVIKEIRNKGGDRGKFVKGGVALVRNWSGVPSHFGSSYTMIREGITEQHFLVFTNILWRLGVGAGLHPVIEMPDEALQYIKDCDDKPGIFSYDVSRGTNDLGLGLKRIIVFEKK